MNWGNHMTPAFTHCKLKWSWTTERNCIHFYCLTPTLNFEQIFSCLPVSLFSLLISAGVFLFTRFCSDWTNSSYLDMRHFTLVESTLLVCTALSGLLRKYSDLWLKYKSADQSLFVKERSGMFCLVMTVIQQGFGGAHVGLQLIIQD